MHPVYTQHAQRIAQTRRVPRSPEPCYEPKPSRPTVAIIGSGISGAASAYLLSSAYDVTVFEQHPIAGMDAYSIDVPSTNASIKDTIHVGTPPRVSNVGEYKNLLPLFQDAGVELERFYMGISLSQFHGATLNAGMSTLLQTVKRKWWPWRPLSSWRMIVDYARLLWAMHRHYPSLVRHPRTMGTFLQEQGYSQAFIITIVFPIMSSIYSCSLETCMAYPAHIVAEQYLTIAAPWYLVKYGAGDSSATLMRRVEENRLHFNTTVVRIERGQDGRKPQVIYRHRTGRNQHEKVHAFDHVLLTSQSYINLQLLGPSATENDRNVLSTIPYVHTSCVVHRDVRLLPPIRKNWEWSNFIIGHDIEHPKAMLSMYWNLPNDEPLFQTWDPFHEPDPKLIEKKMELQRSIVTLESLSSVRKMHTIQGHGQVWIAGAYTVDTAPLQESGVISAMRVARMLGVVAPWKVPIIYENQRQLNALYSTSLLSKFPRLRSLDLVQMQENLVRMMGHAIQLDNQSSVLSVGVGCGDDLVTVLKTFDVASITGVEAVQNRFEDARAGVLFDYLDSEENRRVSIVYGMGTNMPIANTHVSNVISINSACHFSSRSDFYDEAFRVLRSNGGKFGSIDLAFHWPCLPFMDLKWLGLPWLIEKLVCIPRTNQMSMHHMEASMILAGFSDTVVKDISQTVIMPTFWSMIQMARDRKQNHLSMWEWIQLIILAVGMVVLYLIGVLRVVVLHGMKN